MKTSPFSNPARRYCQLGMVLGLGLTLGGQLVADEPYGYRTQQPGSYPAQPRPPSFGDRVVATGQNVGSFFKRVFYGERAPAAYVQQPNYQRPGGSTGRVAYSLDAPPAPPQPKYSTPPRTSTSAAVKADPDAPPASGPAPRKSKPSTFSKPTTVKSTPKTSKPAPSHPTVVDEPPATSLLQSQPPAQPPPPVAPEPPQLQSNPAETYPLPGQQPRPAANSTSSVGTTVAEYRPQEPLPPQEPVAPEPPVTSSSAGSGSSKTADSSSSGAFLVGKKSGKSGRVVSPYPPYNELDITGLPSGSLALDPTTQKVFQVP